MIQIKGKLGFYCLLLIFCRKEYFFLHPFVLKLLEREIVPTVVANNYSQAAEQMKEMLIDAYLQKNPGIKRSEVTTKLVNGRIVIETVSNVLQNAASRIQKKVAFSPQEKSLLKQLAKGGDERYAECLDSISSSKKYVDFLHDSHFVAFGDKEKNETLEFLTKKDEISGKRALDILNVKKKLVGAMKNKVKASKSLVQTMTLEYMQAVHGQLKAQGIIYNKEIDLGNTFTNHVESFIQKNIRQAQTKLDKKSLITMATAYQVATNIKIDPVEIPKKIEGKEFDQALQKVKDHLSKLRIDFDSIQKMILFMESIVEELQKAKDQDLSGEPKEEKETGPSGPRMAFSTKSRATRRR